MQFIDDMATFEQMTKLICDPECSRWSTPFNDGTGWSICDGRILICFDSVTIPDDMSFKRQVGGVWVGCDNNEQKPPRKVRDVLIGLPEANMEVPFIQGPPAAADKLWRVQKECAACDGAGWRECDMGHQHDCDDCDGDGDCMNVCDEATEAIEIHGEAFSRRYVWIMSQLPGVKMCSELRDTHKLGFTFQSGRGALMGRRRE